MNGPDILRLSFRTILVTLICNVAGLVNGQILMTNPGNDTKNSGQLFKNNCGLVDTNLCYSTQPFPKVDFAISKVMETSANAALYQSPLLMDMNNDCIPEIIMSSLNGFSTNPRVTSGLTIVNTTNGETMRSINTAFYSWGGPSSFAIADINLDGFPELVIAAAESAYNPPALRGRLICYDSYGDILWVSNETYGDNTGTDGSGGAPAFADFNQDGIPEVYIYNEIFNALTGVKLADGGGAGQGNALRSFNNFSYATTIAANLDNDPNDLELAAGYSIYKINIANVNGKTGNTMVAYNITVDNARRDGYTSIADVNGDNILDVIVSHQGDEFTSRLYVYSLIGQVPTLIAKTAMPSNQGGCCPNACGPAFVGDIAGNGMLVIGVTRAYMLLTYRYNGTTALQENWRISTNDESGTTGMTMFDFNQDGTQEIVYRDETLLRIINGAVNPPVDLASFSCVSGTGSEYPIVGDIDFTGESKICVSCASGSARNIGKIHVFAAPFNQQSWAPSRGIWNQYNYHVVNIEDNLSVPKKMQNSAISPDKRNNNFLVQASLLDSSGNFLQTSVDITGKITCLYFDPVSNLYTANFSVSNKNTATASLHDPLIITFYSGSPYFGGTLIGTYTINLPITPGRTLHGLSYTFSISGLIELFLVFNSKGSIDGGPLETADFIVSECDYQNNLVSTSDIQKIVSVDNNICSGDSLFFNDKWYKEEGEFIIIKPSANSCDTILRFNLTLHEITANDITHEICFGDSVQIEQSWISTDTSILISNLSQYGCDSLTTVNVKVFYPQVLSEVIKACEGDSVWVNGSWWHNDRIVLDTLFDDICPQYSRKELTFHESYSFTEHYTLCPFDTLQFHGLNCDSPGLYSIPFKTINGCDSVFMVQVDSIYSPGQPQFVADCNEGLYEATSENLPNWEIAWSNGSYSITTIFPDSATGYVNYVHDSLDCLVSYPFYLEEIPGLADLPEMHDTIIYPGKPIIIALNLPEYLWNVSWKPKPLVACDTCFVNTLVTYENVQVNIEFLHVSGCLYSKDFTINVDGSLDIQIPNVFAPEAIFPNNSWTWLIPDCFYVDFVLVYDRWGNKILEMNNPVHIDWDGYFNGSLLEAGVFTFIAAYTRPDGSVVYKSGDLTLIR